MKPNPPQYATGWHQCFRCGCTYGSRDLRLFHRVDTVLRIDEQVHLCTDEERCARMKLERDEVLRLDRERLAVAKAAPTITKRTA